MIRTQHAGDEPAIRSVPVPQPGAGVPSARQAARLNDNAPRSDAFSATTSKAAKAATAKPVPPVQPTDGPRHGRRATDRPGFAYASPAAFKPAAGFLAQLISQNGLADTSANPDGGTARSPSQQGLEQRVGAYRRSQGLTTPFDAAAANPAGGAELLVAPGARVIKIEI